MRILKAALPVVALLASVIGVQAQTVQTVLSYPLGIQGVAVDYVAGRTYVLLPNFNADGSTAIQVLDAKSNAVLATYSAPGSAAIAVNVITGRLYVAGTVVSATNPSGYESEVFVLNQKTGAVLATVPVSANSGPGINSLVADPLHYTVYAANQTDNAIAVINTKTNTLKASLDLAGQTPIIVAMNAFSGTLFASLGNNQVAVYNPYTKVLKYAVYGNNTFGLAADPIQNVEYVTDAEFDGTGTVGVLTSKGVTKTSELVGTYATGVDVDFVSNRIYVANQADGTIQSFTGNKGETSLIADNTVTSDANDVKVNPVTQKIYGVGSVSLTILSEE